MICVSIAAMSLFLYITQIDVTITDQGMVVHATEGDVTYSYEPEQDAYCYERKSQ
jgi:hypothetical protein